MTRPFWFYRQSGVIPYRIIDGEIEVLLVTSRGGARWIIPKGVVELGMSEVDSASKEAFEEAGIVGDVTNVAHGAFKYQKWGDVCTVTVFLMRVTRMLDEWPERSQRKRRWMSLKDAADAVREGELRELIRRVRDVDPLDTNLSQG